MFVVSVRAHYDAAHFLRNYPGPCQRLHGHRYEVEVALAADELNEAGIAYDFAEVKRHLDDLVGRFDHRNLNDIAPFTEIESSAENQAKYIHDELKRFLPEGMRGSIVYVRVWETPTQWAQYSERKLFA